MVNKYIPINLGLKDCKCLVVGGGAVALRKIDTLLEYDTTITVVAPDVDPKIKYYADKGHITLEVREYRTPEAADYRLVISASDDPAVNKQVYDDSRDTGALVNVVDNPSLCDFILPAMLRRGALTVAISTDGKAPFLSGHLRIVLENIFPEHWNKLMEYATDFRKMTRKRWSDDQERRNRSFERFVTADWKTLLKESTESDIDETLKKMLED